jgi:hypothetical protein
MVTCETYSLSGWWCFFSVEAQVHILMDEKTSHSTLEVEYLQLRSCCRFLEVYEMMQNNRKIMHLRTIFILATGSLESTYHATLTVCFYENSWSRSTAWLVELYNLLNNYQKQVAKTFVWLSLYCAFRSGWARFCYIQFPRHLWRCSKHSHDDMWHFLWKKFTKLTSNLTHCREHHPFH